MSPRVFTSLSDTFIPAMVREYIGVAGAPRTAPRYTRTGPTKPKEFCIDPVIEAYKAGLDRTLLRENRRRSPEERIRNLMELQRLAAEVRRAAKAGRRGQ